MLQNKNTNSQYLTSLKMYDSTKTTLISLSQDKKLHCDKFCRTESLATEY
jgi:hypothetical protein